MQTVDQEPSGEITQHQQPRWAKRSSWIERWKEELGGSNLLRPHVEHEIGDTVAVSKLIIVPETEQHESSHDKLDTRLTDSGKRT